MALRKEPPETKLQLNNFIRDNSQRLEKEGETEANLAKVTSEISDLRNRIDAGGRELENQRSEVDKVRKEAEVGELRTEIKTLKDRLLSSKEELQKLKASVDEGNSKLKQLLESGTQESNTALNTLASKHTTLQGGKPSVDASPSKRSINDLPELWVLS